MEITQSEEKRKGKKKKKEDSLRDFWNNVKHTNIHIIVVPGGKHI